MTPILATKLTLVPLLIWGITQAGRTWGPAVAGWLSAFPVVGGPILLFVTIEQGPQFGAISAAAMLLAVAAHLSFGLTYAWLTRVCAWPASLAASLAAYALVVALINQIHVGLLASAIMILALLLVAGFLYPRLPTQTPHDTPSAHLVPALRGPTPSRMPAELWLRMIAGALLVLAVTWAARSLGAKLAGMLAMFPVLGTVLAVFSHRQSGALFTIKLLRSMVLGYYAFGSFCIALALSLPTQGTVASFVWATTAALVVQLATRRKVA